MNLIPSLFSIAPASAFLGASNALGLWWTVRALASTRHPGRLLLLNFALRATLTLGPIFILADGRLDRLVIGLGAFVIGRLIAVKILGSVAPAPGGLQPGGSSQP